MEKLLINVLLLIFLTSQASGQRKILHLPNLPGYVTLKCDFHMHTVFSDGDVWPTIRIDEAFRDGLDAISITDHIDYNTRKNFISVDHEAAWKICEKYAKERNLLLIHGIEITRDMPPGHVNALFITDASLIVHDSVWDCYEAAIKQGAFLQWNHPGAKFQQPDGIPTLYDIHKRLIKNGWLHGIEFANGGEFYPKVFTLCKQNKLTMLGNTDAHGILSERYGQPGSAHRTMTLVFAKERNQNSIKEALFTHRTMVYTGETLAGEEEFARLFFYQCISVTKPYYQDERNIYIEVTNNSDIPFFLVNGVPNAPSSVTLAANSVTRIVLSKKVNAPLTYDVKNVFTGENEMLKVVLKY